MSFKSIDGQSDRRAPGEQKIIWDREPVIGCARQDVFDRRADPATMQALLNMFHTVRAQGGQGVVFAIMNANGTMDIGSTGVFYDSPILTRWAVDRLENLVRSLPGHPDLI